MKRKPSVKTMLVCEKVLHDCITNTYSLVNILYAVEAPEYPLVTALHVYLCVTELHQQAEIEVRLVRKSDESVVHCSELTIDCTDPLIYVQTVSPPLVVEFPEPGGYEVQVWHQDEFLDSMELIAHAYEEEEHEVDEEYPF